MAKTYKDYCREAVQRDPKTYGSMFNEDGSRKSLPNMSNIYKQKRILSDIPKEELKNLKRSNCIYKKKDRKPELEIRGAEIIVKGRKLNLTILKMPKNPTKKEYNRVWMHNCRVRERINKLKKQYGAAVTI